MKIRPNFAVKGKQLTSPLNGELQYTIERASRYVLCNGLSFSIESKKK